MNVASGVSRHQVLQRNAGGRASATLSGNAQREGTVWLRVMRGGKCLPRFTWRRTGYSINGIWQARLENLPTGGPYTMEAEIRDAAGGRAVERTAVRDILVGDLWILAGQSNMEGQGDFDCAERPHPLVSMFAKRRQWVRAEEPTHFWLESPDSAHWYGMNEEQWRKALADPQPERVKGASPGLAFGRAMALSTGVPVGLLPTALGGSSMEQWNPAYKNRGVELLYGSMLAHVRDAGGPPVAGVLWWQGESEAFLDTLVPPFYDAFLRLAAAMREALGDPRIPFIYVQIGRVSGMGVDPRLWNAVQEAQRRAASVIPDSAMTAAVDLPLDDGIHVSGYGQNVLGRRLAKLAMRLRFGSRVRSGPQFAGAAVEGKERKLVRVRFGEVNGRLLPERRVAGFSFRDAEGKDLQLIYEAMPDPARPADLLLRLDATPPPGASLWYGAGTNPYCNLVDAEEMPALVFGPADITHQWEGLTPLPSLRSPFATGN